MIKRGEIHFKALVDLRIGFLYDVYPGRLEVMEISDGPTRCPIFNAGLMDYFSVEVEQYVREQHGCKFGPENVGVSLQVASLEMHAQGGE